MGKPERFLRVTHTPRESLVTRAGEKLGILPDGSSQPQAPTSVEIKRSFGWTRDLRLGEVGRITSAIEALGEKTDGTSLNYSQYKIESVRIDGQGKEHVKELPRLVFGWESKVHSVHKRRIKVAQRDVLRGTHTNVLSTLKGDNPVSKAVASVGVEHKIEAKLEAKKRRSIIGKLRNIRWYGWRAGLVARIIEQNPVKAGKNFLKPGQSRESIYSQLRGMMLQVADAQMDPVDRIHGPFEAPLKMLQNFQSSLGGLVFNQYLDRLGLFDNLAAGMVTLNKAMSRDIQGGLNGIRRVAGLYLYGRLSDALFKKIGEEGEDSRRFLPPLSLVEESVDKRMQKGNGGRLAKTHAILYGTDFRDPLSRVHQRVVAEEFVRAYNAPSPLVEVFSHLAVTRVESSVSKATQAVDGIRQKAMHALTGMLPKFMRPKKSEFPSVNTSDARQAWYDAVAAYGSHPMSVKEQVDTLLSHADSVLAIPTLTVKERYEWQLAKNYAVVFNAMEQQAEKMTADQAPYRRTSPETV